MTNREELQSAMNALAAQFNDGACVPYDAVRN
jgi:hypothetical protein